MTAYRRISVPVDGGELTVGLWGHGAPVVLALHGITASHLAWAVVAERFDGAGTLAAVDLRGRGGSAALPGPYGMVRHAADCVAVLDALGVPAATVAGHSMGGFVAVVLADRYPERVSRLALVDGGAPLPPPPGVATPGGVASGGAASGGAAPAAPAGGGEPAGVMTEEQIAGALGPAARRLSMRFADRAAYHEFWRAHPAFQDWSPAIEAYVDYDITGGEPQLRSRVPAEALREDFTDLHLGEAPAQAWAALRHPAEFLRAERGLLDQPIGMYPDPAPIAARIPLRTVPGTNHYTILLADPGATVVAALLRHPGVE